MFTFEDNEYVGGTKYYKGEVDLSLMHSDSGFARAAITNVLERLHRRTRINAAIGLLTNGLWGFAILLLLLKLFGLWDIATVRVVILSLYVLVVFGFILRHFTGRPILASSAGLADRQADLKDELKSAWDFMFCTVPTLWTELQISKAAVTVGELEEEAVEPIIVPRRAYAAGGVSAILVAVLFWNPPWARDVSIPLLLSFTNGPTPMSAITLEDDDLTVDAVVDPDSLENKEEEEESELLQQGAFDLAADIQDLLEANRGITDSSVDINELRSGLEEFGEQLDVLASIAELAEALKFQESEEAARLLRELADRMSEGQTSEDLQALVDSLRDAAEGKSAELADLLESLQDAAGEMSAQNLAEAQQAISDYATQVEQMGEKMLADQQAGAQGQQQPQQMEASAGDPQPGQQQMGQNQQSQAMEGAAGMAGNQVQLAQLEGAMQNAVPLDSGPSGHSTGAGAGEEAVLGEATLLEVQLEMELLDTDDENEPVPEEIFEKQSREEKSNIDYENVRQRWSYKDEKALNPEFVPWHYRSLIKRYFLSIQSNAEKSIEK